MMYVGTSADIKVKRKYHSEDQGSKTKTKPVGNLPAGGLRNLDRVSHHHPSVQRKVTTGTPEAAINLDLNSFSD
ncbi:hypothetical protein MCOR29_010980 [Pyricularia oryzae]|uniref:GIY-YIG domain-containing protein n=1 Tax=Pyricularia grisea TaxID=148305 RepID=A0ABQ8N9C6_PYRGI|nr:hypothetical protein MCOR01_006559 [Pyricularia oryzae]KAI6292965.1 hypothetical protein MCOR33_009475 [Pyricularia grisea]KAI6254184.1 hypothetical protein MCOR19_009309 [Pyricularia oryzae]KAI6300314.1 hypothetical protein MCOR29_010980 [Pyricularia oryzae]KAI6322227.1 hypothetical protein MCOR30_007716 [Pyricularia oryzae]